MTHRYSTKLSVALSELALISVAFVHPGRAQQPAQGPEAAAVNIARAEWGTLVTATSQFSDQHGVRHLIDGSHGHDGNWLSRDNVDLPQYVTFEFEKEMTLTRVKVAQANFAENMYRTRDFRLEVSLARAKWREVAAGKLDKAASATAELSLAPTSAKALRLVVTSSYNKVQTCGLDEVEIYAALPKDAKPPHAYAGAQSEIQWNTLRGMFKLALNLSPAASGWLPETQGRAPEGEYHSRGYRLVLKEEKLAEDERVLTFEITRPDGKPFKVLNSEIECKRSYSGVYKMFCPSSMVQQNYKVDLPFTLGGNSGAMHHAPVIWMQQTDGRNVLTVGLLDQLPITTLGGRTYSEANGGEAPGIANSYVSASLKRFGTGKGEVTSYGDGLYINAAPAIGWEEALLGYSRAVDRARGFQPQPLGADAFNPMWHSWYAHGADINEKQLRADARRAAALGVKTIEIDAGWNMVGWNYAMEGCHDFEPARFPDAKGMIAEMHKLGLKVILHVSPLLMGGQARTYNEMKDCVGKFGTDRNSLDPRYKKVHEYLLKAWEKLYSEYGVDGLWYDFLEIPACDPPHPGMELVSTDVTEGYTMLMQALYQRSLELNPNAVIILRRASANLNAKTYCTHVWPMDTPQDYNMNRRDVVYMKTYGAGVLTHACCTSWAISESDENVACQMASIVLAGVPAFSVKLAESPKSHNEIITAWLKFYEPNKRDLVLGRLTPLLPTPPSAALRIEGEKQAFFGFFEAAPGLLTVSRPMEKITLVNAFSARTCTRIEGLAEGAYQVETFDQVWKPVSQSVMQSAGGGLTLDVTGPSRCHSIVITRR